MSELLKHTRIGPLELLIIVGVPLVLVVLFFSWVGRVMRRGAERRERERQAAERAAAARARPASVERHVEKERVIERQVLVMRCAYCKKLTPADLSACSECGAKL